MSRHARNLAFMNRENLYFLILLNSNQSVLKAIKIYAHPKSMCGPFVCYMRQHASNVSTFTLRLKQ